MEEDKVEKPDEKEKKATQESPKEDKKSFTEKIRENPWVASTIVLGVIVLIFLIGGFGGITGGSIMTGGTIGVSENQAAENLVDFANAQGAGAELIDVVKDGEFYKVTLSLNGQETPVLVTKDGNNIVQLIPISTSDYDTQPEPKDVPKSDKPKVELYVYTYCPYGTQMEKAMIPVVDLLGDKIDFKIRQIGAMHGEYEKIEAERQLCIEKEYPDKFLDYVLEFALNTDIGSCNGDATCLAPKLNALFTSLGIDSAKITSCISSEGEKLYNAEVKNAGNKGSPTIIINGVEIQSFPRLSDRYPEKVKEVICNAFNNIPSECSKVLSTESPSAGFGSGTSSSASSGSC
ncbi:MAG: hypothetical protein ABII03_06260 [Nanoarchaeota archaeon]